MNKKATPFEEIRRKKAKKKMIKKIYILILFCLLVFSVYFIYQNNYYFRVVDNINGVCKVLKKGKGFPVKLNVAEIKGKSKIGNEVLIVDDNTVNIFNRYGYRTLLKAHQLNEPRIVSNNRRAVLFEQLGKKIKIYSKTSELFSKELNSPILNVSISNDNKIAIVKSANRFLTGIEIWNSECNNIFTWDTSKEYITSVSFFDNNKDFIVSSLKVKNAEYISTISFFNINKGEKLNQVELKDDIVISVKCKNNNVYIVGEKNSYIIGSNGKEKYRYNYHGKVLNGYNLDCSKNIVLIFENYNRLENNKLIVLGNGLKEVFEFRLKGNVKCIDSNGKKIYLLTDENIQMFDINSKNKKMYNVGNDVVDIISTPQKLYKLNISELDIIK